MTDKINTKVIQITNVAPSASKDQMKTLFGFLGRVEECKVYPTTEQPESDVSAKVCYIKYDDSTSTGIALHLTNTVFIDRALIVVPVMDGRIPDEITALKLAPSAVAGMIPGTPSWPSNVISQMTGSGATQMITTYDPRLTALGLPQYPAIPGHTDPAKIEEIRRTVYVGNLAANVSSDQVLKFFSQVGEVKYVRMAGEEFAFVEFTDQRSVATALTYNGVMFQGKPITVNHSNNAITKPVSKTQEAAQREIEEAMKKVKEAQSLISAAVDEPARRSRSRSASKPRKHRSRSRSRKRSRSRSRKRSRSRRSRSRRRSHSRRSRSRGRKSRSRSRRRSTSRSRKRRSRSRKRSRSRRKSRSRSRGRSRRSKSRSSVPKEGAHSFPDQRTPKEGANGFPKRRRSRTPPRAYSRRSRSRSRKRSKSPKVVKPVEKKKRSHSKSLSPPKLEREDSVQLAGKETSVERESSSSVKKENSNFSQSPPPIMDKSINTSQAPATQPETKPLERRSSSERRSHSPSPKRRVSRSPVKSSRRSRSGSRSRGHKSSKRSRRSRSRSRKRSRSRSGSRHRSRKDKKRDRDRSRDRDRDRERDSDRKRRHREKDRDREEKTKETKIKRNYDEEEKYIQEDYSSGADDKSGNPPAADDINLQSVDMDMSD